MKKLSITFENVVSFNLEKTEAILDTLKPLEIEYPNFAAWYRKTVCDGLKNKTRSILLAYDDEQKIAGISILKNFPEKKLCTFFVVAEFRHCGIGTEMMKKSIEILGTTSPIITVSENHIAEFKALLQNFGFKEFHRYQNYYREGQDEISYNGFLDRRALFSIKPEFAFKILSGEKIFEYRKTKTKENISHIVIYASSPVKKVVGEVKVADVISGIPEEIWKYTREFSGIDYDFYQKYFSGKKVAHAYHLQCPIQYQQYKDLIDFNVTRAPQSYQYL